MKSSIGVLSILFQHERKIRLHGLQMPLDASIKDSAEEVGLVDAVSSSFGLLLRTGTWDNTFASNYDKVSAKLMFNTRQDFDGTEEVFPGGYKQILTR